jgi:hypothetical protein
MRLTIQYTLSKNINGGDFVPIMLHDLGLVHVWMGRAQNDVVKDEESAFFKMLRVQWWDLMKKGANIDE